MSQKILMPIGDATEALDTYYAYYRLPEDDYEVVVAGPEARLYHTVPAPFAAEPDSE
jgi:protease I